MMLLRDWRRNRMLRRWINQQPSYLDCLRLRAMAQHYSSVLGISIISGMAGAVQSFLAERHGAAH